MQHGGQIESLWACNYWETVELYACISVLVTLATCQLRLHGFGKAEVCKLCVGLFSVLFLFVFVFCFGCMCRPNQVHCILLCSEGRSWLPNSTKSKLGIFSFRLGKFFQSFHGDTIHLATHFLSSAIVTLKRLNQIVFSGQVKFYCSKCYMCYFNVWVAALKVHGDNLYWALHIHTNLDQIQGHKIIFKLSRYIFLFWMWIDRACTIFVTVSSKQFKLHNSSM